MTKKFTLAIFLFSIFSTLHAQTFAGIEIGSKGVKMSIIEVSSIKKSIYDVKNFWTENVGIAKGISESGKLNEEDMNNAVEIVKKNYNKILNEYKVDNKNIFVVASSGVGMATNTDELIEKVKNAIPKDLDVITSQLESKLMLKGCIPPKLYLDGLLIDIGGGNTKGGYVELRNDDKEVFFPLNLNWGTITLTERINKENATDRMSNYVESQRSFRSKLRTEIKEMYKSRAMSQEKKNIYLSGGAAWAFYTLFYEGEATQNFNEITLDNVLYYNEILLFNFEKYQTLAKTNPGIERVLKTYSQKHLISANNLLIEMLENINNIDNKKLYFAKQGQIAWLLSYVADFAKGAKPMY